MFPGLYELLDKLIPEFSFWIDIRWVVAWVLILIGVYGLFFRWPRG